MPLPTCRSVLRSTSLVLACGMLWLAACKDAPTEPESTNAVTISLQEVVNGLSAPTFVTAAPDDLDRLFIVQRGGLIRIFGRGSLNASPFLDISDQIAAGGERGLLGMAFHPDYRSNGYFYVDYTDAGGDTQVSRFTVSGNPDLADSGSELPLLSVEQPYANHNGGMLAFGPDGMLYVGMGDGGSAGDPDGNGQDATTALGALLRLDVDGAPPYAIPADNPFAGHPTYREEIWAYGLRNPWRFSFDRETGDLYVADVGQSQVEELDFQAASSSGGENYGWNVMEGTQCYAVPTGCSSDGLTLPVHQYDHGAGCSVTGGYVYRGSASPALAGRYFYADYCSGWIRSFTVVGGVATDLEDHSADVPAVPQLASFGEDAAGELYVVSLAGTVYRLDGVEASETP